MHEILLVGADADLKRVMLAALTEGTVRRPMQRHKREITVSMRERGKELLPGAEETKAELIASNLAAHYAIGTALTTPEEIPAAMEISVLAGDTYCGRLRFSCEEDAAPDTLILMVSADDPNADLDLFRQALQVHPGVPALIALCVNRPPREVDNAVDAAARLMPAFFTELANRPHSAAFWHPSGFQNDGTPCTPEHAAPLGAAGLFWETVKLSSAYREPKLLGKLRHSVDLIQRRNGIYQARSPRRSLELKACRAAYARDICGLYEARTLLAAENGSPLTPKGGTP